MKKWADIFGFNHIAKRSDGKIWKNGVEVLGAVLEINNNSGVIEIRDGLIDELLISPKAHTEEQIQSWYNSQAPFYDANRVDIEDTAKAYAEAKANLAQVNAESYADGIVTTEEQARINDATAKLALAKTYTEGWSEQGATPNNFNNYEGNAESVLLNSEGITATAPNGDYTRLNSNMLAFYKFGYTIPHWYSKRVAYDTAQDGDYIDLAVETGVPWDKIPKVQTAIKGLQTFDATNAQSNQKYVSYPSGITKDGFYITGQLIIEEGSYLHDDYGFDMFDGVDAPPWISSNSRTDVTRIELTVKVKSYEGDGSILVDIVIQYKEINSSSWITYQTFYGMRTEIANWGTILTINCDVSNLANGTYHWKVYAHDNQPGLDRDRLRQELSGFVDYKQETIDTGEVMWIAIEGGAD